MKLFDRCPKLILGLLFLGSCTPIVEVQNKTHHKIKINETKDIVFEHDNIKHIYTTQNAQKHGISYQFDQNNNLKKKSIFFFDTLLQEKEYYWKENKLDSIVFSSYIYDDNGQIQKMVCVKPRDGVFFTMKYKFLNNKEQPFYRIELIGDGGIGVFSLNDSIYDSEFVNSNWNKMRKAEKYFVYECDDDTLKSSKQFAQTYFLLKKNDDYITVGKQLRLYYVPLFIEDTSFAFSNYEITF